MRLCAGLMLMAVLMCAPHARAQESAALVAAGPSVVTTGEATVRLAPDRAFVTLAVETRDNNPRTAQRQNAEAMSSVQKRIATSGIARDAVRTTGYSIQQEFDFSNGRRTPRGYVARNGIDVRVDAVERVGELLDALVNAGATTVSGVRFDLKDRASAEREALRLAVIDARARADAMAAGAGRTVDRVLRITDSAQPRFKPASPVMMMERAAGAAAETPVAPGEIEVYAQVELTSSLK